MITPSDKTSDRSASNGTPRAGRDLASPTPGAATVLNAAPRADLRERAKQLGIEWVEKAPPVDPEAIGAVHVEHIA
mgnify:CR=1 FL=1